MNIIAYLIVAAVLYSVWGLSVRFGLKKLSCNRKFSQPAFFEGDEGELVEVVRNDRPFIIPWFRVESRISSDIRLGSQDNLDQSGEMYYTSLFTLMPYQQITRKHKVRFLHRGAYNLGNASLTAGDVLDLFQAHRTQDLSAPVLVYPRLMADDEIPLPMSRTLGELSRRPQLLQDPFLIRGIRPYQPGDPVRDIHWAATARTGEVHVRLHDYSARTRLLVVLNTQLENLQWDKRLPENKEPIIEKAISLAASLCVRGIRSGLAVGFAANMPLDGEEDSVILTPEDGAAQEEALLTAFARLKIIRTDNFPTFLETLTRFTGLDILILSCYDCEQIRAEMDQLIACGNQVSLHLLEGGEP